MRTARARSRRSTCSRTVSIFSRRRFRKARPRQRCSSSRSASWTRTACTFAEIHMLENRLYIFEATVPKGARSPALFQQSVGFVDKDGVHVRGDPHAREPSLYFRGDGSERRENI